MGQGEQDGRQAVKGDDHHYEAREIEPKDSQEHHDPACDIISHPGHSYVPGDLQRNLKEDNLKQKT